MIQRLFGLLSGVSPSFRIENEKYKKKEKQLTFERECTMMRFREEHLFAWRVI